jgi:PAS domain S-box-containing protein
MLVAAQVRPPDGGTGSSRERRLAENEERLRLALRAANQGLYDLNVQTGEARVSPEYAEMLGFDPAEFQETNSAWIARLHPDDREPVAAVYRDYIAGRLPEYRVEFRQRTRTGEWLWILSLGSVVERTADGRPLRMLGTHTDITALKHWQLALEQFKHTLDQTRDCVFIFGVEDLRFTYVNEGARQQVGYTEAELLGMTPLDIEPEFTETAFRAMLSALTSGTSSHLADPASPQGRASRTGRARAAVGAGSARCPPLRGRGAGRD